MGIPHLSRSRESSAESSSPAVSVVVPVYNVEPWIRQCLDSLTNQTLSDIEILLIDDCSTDGSSAICEEYAARDGRVILLHNEANIRQGLSRNRGIDLARGEFVGFVDPDDWVDPRFYEKLYAAATAGDADIAKAAPVHEFADGTSLLSDHQNGLIQRWMPSGTPLFHLFCHEHWSAIFRREVLVRHEIRYPDIRNGEDDIFLLAATYHARSIALVEDVHYHYRQRPDSALAVRAQPFFESILDYFSLYVAFLNDHEMTRKEYDRAFQLGFWRIRHRYGDLEKAPDLDEFRKEFVERALLTLLKYRYELRHVMDNVFLEAASAAPEFRQPELRRRDRALRRLRSVAGRLLRSR